MKDELMTASDSSFIPHPSSFDRVRVVRVSTRLNVGGPARHVAWVTAGLRGAGYDSVLVTGTVPPGEDDISAFARAQGVEPVVISEMSREISPRDAITVWKLYRLLVRLRPDILHTHAAKAGAVGRLAGLLYRWLTPAALLGRPRRCRLVHTYHGHVFHSYFGAWKTRFFLGVEKLLARLATDRIVVICPQQFRDIHERFKVGRAGQFAVIPLGLDLRLFASWPGRREILRGELGAGEGEILVGIVGRLTEIKNHRLFLEAAALFKEKQGGCGPRRVRFVVIGDGHLRPRLEGQARESGLEKDVTFLGMREDPENFYPALDVVALTSLNEGTPLTLLEAMANARPVVATDVGGVVDLLGKPAADQGGRDLGYAVCERGVLVRPGDAAAFCHGLLRLTEGARLRERLGQNGRIFVEKNYSKERLVSDIADLYQELLAPAGAGTAREEPRPLAQRPAGKEGDRCAS
jgi:glycosyltransferase involved in cell wall biosynthesis